MRWKLLHLAITDGSLVLLSPADAYDDVFYRESAAALLVGLRGLDDESAAVTITLYAMEAEVESMRN